ncbi:hypothetical protein Hanom_Chr11g01036611 [Helianthus anomalus]
MVCTTDRNCKEVCEKGSAAVVPKEKAEVSANPGGCASASNSRSRDLVTVVEARMVVTGLVSNNGLLA